MIKKRVFIFVGVGLIFLSLTVFGLIFYQVISVEIRYRLKVFFNQPNSFNQIASMSESEQFEITIPKIDVNSKVLANIDPYNKEEYLKALNKGVAHAKGSVFPGEEGNIFIFAHSTDSPFNISRYNAIFYLLSKLKKGDEIYLMYQGKKYKYIVSETKIVNASKVEYLQSSAKNKSLTLMTCWPPGTTFRRFLVFSNQESY